MNQDNTDSSLLLINLNEKIFEKHKNDNDFKYNFLLQKAMYCKMTERNQEFFKYCIPAYNYFKKTNQIGNEVTSAFLLASQYFTRANYDSTLYFCENYIPLATRINDKKTLNSLYHLKGRALAQKGKLNEAAEVLQQSLEMAKKENSINGIFQNLMGLASIYQELNTSYSLNYLHEAEKYEDQISNEAKNNLYTGLGNAYRNIGKNDSALYFYNENLKVIDKDEDKMHYGAMIGNIGNVYFDMGRLDEALEKQFISIEYFKSANDSLDIEIALGTIADIYLQKGNFKEALNYYNQATAMSLRLGFKEELIYNYTGLYQCYEKMGEFKEAYKNYKLYHQYNDSFRNVEMTKKLTEQEMNYRFENQQKQQKMIQEAKDQLTEEKIKHQRLTIYAGLGGGIILIIFLIVSVRNSNIRKKINNQLAQSHSEIQQQKNIIETKNREITDSIMYASRIQEGILPDAQEIKNLLPNSFLFFRPRDIVSGDFYWVKPLKGSAKVGTGDLVGVVIADCTGHGVPGAFMSFIGSTILNQTINNKKIETPADALNYLNEQLPLTLQSKVKTGQINDGMEAGICVINRSVNKLTFAGANLNLIHIRNNIVNEIKGDKHSIGLNSEQQKTFTDIELELQKGDCIYMFSDGYPDQFGGEKGKKYKYKNLLNFLNDNSKFDADTQHKLLSENFDKWKGSLEQLDDVLLFGMKI
jgi:serine phosphatase RsbU (regulator of sigma subunit)